MFDIGFAELVLVAVVGLLVIGPERLPEAIRTTSHWLGRLKRGFNDIKQEVQQELHNDEVMQELRKTGQQFKTQTNGLGKSLDAATASLAKPALDDTLTSDPPAQPADKSAE